MKVLVTGATGLIGSAVCARLSQEGHEVIAAVRPGSRPPVFAISGIAGIDMSSATSGEWARHLAGCDAVVNCVGVFQDSLRDDTRAVHVTGAGSLFEACEKAGVRRVVHISAIGIDREQPSAFSATKLEGDQLLMERNLDWVILRPSVVLGRSVYGASAMFRGLAALPLMPKMKDTGSLQVVQLDDVAETVSFFIRAEAPARVTLELAGPEKLSMEDIVAAYRKWLGWLPARSFTLPDALAKLMYRAGDFAGFFGWRAPMRSTAQKEIRRGAVGDPSQWISLTGIAPASLRQGLTHQPATVQERWFARVYFLKPLAFVVLPFFWIGTGIVSLTGGYDDGVHLMLRAGTGDLAGPGVIAGALADIVAGIAIAFRRTARYGLYGAIALCLFYAVTGSILLPELWLEPLGPLMKILPILVLHLVALALLDDR